MKRWHGVASMVLGIGIVAGTILAMPHGEPVGGNLVWVLMIGGAALFVIVGLAVLFGRTDKA
ncbi:MAG: hypothetical protein GC165_10825 [Armatimonadetes bacterium]|nr:hypothetical protein [Armatimonadota bacterium]